MPDDLDTIPGWFYREDQTLFTWFLSRQVRDGTKGDLAELGPFQGKSAVLMGRHLQDGETFTVVDLFESPAVDESNRTENRTNHYSGLTQQVFERNYLRFHPRLPVVVRGLSQQVVEHAAHGTHRWVHIDASHLYEHVAGDIDAARVLLQPEGIVVLDDIRSGHTPGVWAAAWEAVLRKDLHPILVSGSKMYATWGDPGRWQDRLLADRPDTLEISEQSVLGARLLISWQPPQPKSPRRRFIEDWAPPVAVRAVAERRRRAAG